MVSYKKILIPVIVAALCLSGCAKRPASGSKTAVIEKETETVDAMEDVSTRDLYYKSRGKISVVDAVCRNCDGGSRGGYICCGSTCRKKQWQP